MSELLHLDIDTPLTLDGPLDRFSYDSDARHRDLLEIALGFVREEDGEYASSARSFRYWAIYKGFTLDHTEALLILEEAESMVPLQRDINQIVRYSYDQMDDRIDYRKLSENMKTRRIRLGQRHIDAALYYLREPLHSEIMEEE